MLAISANAQTYDTNGAFVQNFAGSAFQGYIDGQGQATMFNQPAKIVADSSGNLFVLDVGNLRIRKIAPDATVTTFAGGGTHAMPGFGTNISITFAASSCFAIDHSNTIFVGVSPNTLVKITPDGYATPTNQSNFATSAGLCVDSVNNIYYTGGNKIYVLHPNGVSELFAGSGNNSSIDGNGIFTSFASPSSLAIDGADNIVVWDSGSYKFRTVNQNKDVFTIYSNPLINSINSMLVDSGGNIIFIGSSIGTWIGKITPSTNLTILAGSATQYGFTNGVGSLARFYFASGICNFSGVTYVADSGNQRIRSITNNPVPQIVDAGNLSVSNYPGVKITGVIGRTYQIQTSTNMVNWTVSNTLVLNSSPYLWIDQEPDANRKFYRAKLLP